MQGGAALERVFGGGFIVSPGGGVSCMMVLARRQGYGNKRVHEKGRTEVGENIHLLAAVDQTLLCRRDALLLLDALLYPRDLVSHC